MYSQSRSSCALDAVATVVEGVVAGVVVVEVVALPTLALVEAVVVGFAAEALVASDTAILSCASRP